MSQILFEDYDFEKDFITGKTTITSEGYSLVKADKDTSDPNAKVMNIQAKDKYEFINIKRIVTDKYHIDVFGYFENDKTEIKDEGVRIMSTFKASYLSDDIYDLSNVEDGFRTFSAEDINLSFDVPEGYYMSSYEDSQNEFQFDSFDPDDLVSSLIVNVYSKSETDGAEKLAQNDYNHNKKLINESLVE